jgi:two-component system response regulator FlrC
MHLNSNPNSCGCLRIKRFGESVAYDISVDVQVVASTNRDLEQVVREGKFREDLFYRLSVIPIQIPPLRERKEDIPLLVDHFIQRYNTQFRKNVQGVTPEGLKLLTNYSWPGNIRELKNAIERAMILWIATESMWISSHPDC